MSARFIRRRRLGAIPAEAAPFSPRNAVLHGDCIALMSDLPARSVDLVLCDPPYLCGYVDRSGRRVANDTNPAWLVPAFAEAFRVLQDDAYCVSFYGWHQIDRFMSAWRGRVPSRRPPVLHQALRLIAEIRGGQARNGLRPR